MSRAGYIREQLKLAHEAFNSTIADLPPQQAQWVPPGRAHPIAERIAHCIGSEDGLIHGVLKGAPPLMATSFAGMTGSNLADPFRPNLDSARTVNIDLAAARRYGAAVQAARTRTWRD